MSQKFIVAKFIVNFDMSDNSTFCWMKLKIVLAIWATFCDTCFPLSYHKQVHK